TRISRRYGATVWWARRRITGQAKASTAVRPSAVVCALGYAAGRAGNRTATSIGDGLAAVRGRARCLRALGETNSCSTGRIRGARGAAPQDHVVRFACKATARLRATRTNSSYGGKVKSVRSLLSD